jgi:hypothetical protein
MALVHSDLKTAPSEPGEVLNYNIDRILQHIDDLDNNRGGETQDIANNVKRIKDELYDLSDFLHQSESPLPVPQKDQSMGSSTVLSQIGGPHAMPGIPGVSPYGSHPTDAPS